MNKREDTKKLITEKAKETFINNGLLKTVMEDIAKNANISRRTIYRYFSSKEDLAFEVTIGLLKDWNTNQKNIYSNLKGNGIKRLESFLNQLIDYAEKRLDVMKYISEFDFYFQDGSPNAASSDTISRYNEIIFEPEALLEEIIILGKKDKSIKEDLDIKLTVATITNVLWSFGQRIAIRGEIIKKESHLEGVDLIKNQVDIYIKAFKR